MPARRKKTKYMCKHPRVVLVLLLVGALAGAAFLGFFHQRSIREGESIAPLVEMADENLQELSGMVASRRYRGVLWAHSDSGNEPILYALDAGGGSHAIPLEEVTLRDWEAIALSDSTLYITEMGNNLNASENLGIYEFEEPDPKASGPLRPRRFIPVTYEDQESFPARDRWHFDCEAAFYCDGSLYFITKNRPAFRLFVQEGGANLYRLDMSALGEKNLLRRVDSIEDLGGWVTAADISFDGRRLAVLVESPQQSIWLFERPESGDRWFSQAPRVQRYKFFDGGQLESLAFVEEGEDEALVMLNEERQMFRVEMDKFKLVER